MNNPNTTFFSKTSLFIVRHSSFPFFSCEVATTFVFLVVHKVWNDMLRVCMTLQLFELSIFNYGYLSTNSKLWQVPSFTLTLSPYYYDGYHCTMDHTSHTTIFLYYNQPSSNISCKTFLYLVWHSPFFPCKVEILCYLQIYIYNFFIVYKVL